MVHFGLLKSQLTVERNPMAGFSLLLVLFFILNMYTALDTINTSTSISDGETLVSTGQSFELGFFSPTNSTTSRYLGVWYKKSPQTILWVANREVPLSNNLGTLDITTQGILVILNSTNNVVWSSNTPKSTPENPIAQLLGTGNLVVREGNDNTPDNFLWQSFDYPCDNWLPGMKLGGNFATGLTWFLSSWKGTQDPAPGEFYFGIDLQGYPQLVLRRGPRILIRLGSWNGVYFTGYPWMKEDPYVTIEAVLNHKEVYFKLALKNSSVFSRSILYTSGLVQGFSWSDGINDWTTTATSKLDQCENYALCGKNAYCDTNSSPVCTCFHGFVPKSQSDWNMGNWTGGCVRRIPLNCGDQDGFQTYTGFKLPDTSHSTFDNGSSLVECKAMCLQNCSCFAYSSLDIRGGGSGCLRWFGDLSDARTLADGKPDIYIRLAASETVSAEIPKKRTSRKKMHAGIIAGPVIVGTSMLILGMVFCIRRTNLGKNVNGLDKEEDMELPIFDLSTIANATGNFSSSNKLGQGGFGPVHKGTLIEGQEIAVKRLSKSSRQGLNEFKNEVVLIAKLQHRNLVKVLGCCIHEDEKMLIYEFMPNGSLDSFLFDPTRSKLLDWSKRKRIIGGIARGLLYLHQDSRLRIIHRDIKASNILLDSELNPKISDFGLARMFGGDQTEANTVRVVGTYGYMSPEYALDGLFSVKSDVFSFGVLVLEILSGKKNRGFFQPDSDLNLLGHAWMIWVDGTPLDLIDKCLSAESFAPSEALRLIHVALLCVQQRPEDRPNMSSVVLMLGSENALPQPKQPGFSMGRNPPEKDNSQNKHESFSANEVTVTLFEPR